MKFNIVITGAPYESQAPYSALEFVRTALVLGHEVTQVFFYQGAVAVANSLTTPLTDEFNATDQWVELSQEQGVPLVVCVSAAERRGVLNKEQQQDLGKSGFNVHVAFAIEGLGSFHSACLEADRTVTFK